MLTEVRGFGFAEINKLAPELSMEGEAFRLNMNLKNGNEYPKLKPVVFILIATDPVLKNTDKYHSEFAMMEKSERYVLHDLRTLHIIELSKVPPNGCGRLVSWLKFIPARRKEELMALVKENPELQYACNVLMEANSTAEVRALYEVDLKRWRDEQDRTEYAVNEAVKKAAADKDAALKNAEAEKDAALGQTFQLLEQGHSIDEVKTIILKKASASKSNN
jgi:predicted transposase/invertase (TIGR01784 family)